MATKEQLYELAGRAATNPTFKAEVLKDPVAAAESINIKLDDDQKKWLSEKHPQWEAFLNVIGKSGEVGAMNCGTCIVDGH